MDQAPTIFEERLVRAAEAACAAIAADSQVDLLKAVDKLKAACNTPTKAAGRYKGLTPLHQASVG